VYRLRSISALFGLPSTIGSFTFFISVKPLISLLNTLTFLQFSGHCCVPLQHSGQYSSNLLETAALLFSPLHLYWSSHKEPINHMLFTFLYAMLQMVVKLQHFHCFINCIISKYMCKVTATDISNVFNKSNFSHNVQLY
jgi:hypothetical protein